MTIKIMTIKKYGVPENDGVTIYTILVDDQKITHLQMSTSAALFTALLLALPSCTSGKVGGAWLSVGAKSRDGVKRRDNWLGPEQNAALREGISAFFVTEEAAGDLLTFPA